VKRVRISRRAEQDLDDVWYYIVKQSGNQEIADRLVESIAGTFPLFAHTPAAGTKRDEIEFGVRVFPVGNYLIYYAVTELHVVISRVLRGMRDQKAAYRVE